MDISVLEDLGLSEIESKVYLTLLGLGTSGAGQIIKKTALHKATVYNTLDKLIEKGIASFIIVGKERIFRAEPPETFLDMLKYKEQRFREILPELKQKAGALKVEEFATIYSGTQGIKSVCESILEELKPNGTYIDFGVSGLFRSVMQTYWYQWQKKKLLYKIKSKCIFDESVKENKELLKEYVGQCKFTPSKYYSPADTMIYNDKVVLIIWRAVPPFAIKIRSKDLAQAYRNQFKLLWKIAK